MSNSCNHKYPNNIPALYKIESNNKKITYQCEICEKIIKIKIKE